MLASGMVCAGSVALAGAASADTGGDAGESNVAVLGNITHGGQVDILDGADHVQERLAGGTIQLKLRSGTLETYCIDIHNPTSAGTKYSETDWDHSVLSDKKDRLGKIRWILQHAYPVVGPDTLGSKAGVQLNEDTAAAATQAAIWHFSDGVNAHPKDKAADKVTMWLEDQAEKNGSSAEPLPSLQLTPDSVSGNSGDNVGPVTVTTSADKVSLGLDDKAKAAGVSVVDASGNPATTAANGDKLYFKVPAAAPKGEGTLTASTTTRIEVGRVFGPIDKKSQTLILAGSTDVPVSATASGAWAPKQMKGPVPAVTFEKDCAAGGVEVTASNSGDEAFTFTLKGETHTVQPGKSEKILVKVGEDQTYDIKIAGTGGYGPWQTHGVLDCKTSGGSAASPSPSSSPNSPAPAGSTGSTGGKNLAQTGSSSATPVIAGAAAVLVVVGGGLVFFLRKRRSTPSA
ncbi:thioester domain-containing protein [Streptomyces beihaiensis]|uniref:Thioester domain-containing protein n=1 Tax=Streptomyces beihaiensis TaxID=2984495 RepID=A0ABT3TVM1_9ACTN|nr:thioester domain-containing protein [Streptomyces beihaiensis]MCX3060043.1 thioester domain-containing protein [Streptomyces beihaiensis]